MGRPTLAPAPAEENAFHPCDDRGVRHVYECPMRWADMDQLAHINNVTYLDYFQEARVDFGRRIGLVSTAQEGLLVARSEIRYVAPLVFRPEPVLVSVRVTDIRAASFTLAYEVYDQTPMGPRVYATGSTVLTPYVFAAERIRRLEAGERAALEAFRDPDAVRLPRFDLAPVPRQADAHFPVHVRFSDIDGFGHVNNVRYVEYLQEARIAVISRVFGEVPSGRGRASVVVGGIDVEYRRQLTMAERPYDAHTHVMQVGGSSFVLGTEILDHDGEPAARGRVVLVFFDPEAQRSTPPPDDVRAALLRAMDASGS